MTIEEIRRILARSMPDVEVVAVSGGGPGYVNRGEGVALEPEPDSIVRVRSKHDPRHRTRSVIISASGEIVGQQG